MGAKAKRRRAFKKQYRFAKQNAKWANKIRQADPNADEDQALLAQDQNVQAGVSGNQYNDQGDQSQGQDQDDDDSQDWENAEDWEQDFYEDAEYAEDWEDAEYADQQPVDKFGRAIGNIGQLGNMAGGFYSQFGGGGNDNWENAEAPVKVITPSDSSHPDSVHQPINKLLMGLGVALIAYWLIEKI